jgi:hypothetical protein
VLFIFCASITSGWPPYWGRLPGPYLAGAFERSIEPQGKAAALWVGERLPPNERVAADFFSYHLLGAYGLQKPEFNLAPVYTASRIGSAEVTLLRNYTIHYLVVDLRLSKLLLTASGTYFSSSDPMIDHYTEPLKPAWLDKFNQFPYMKRIFDNGVIIIYEVGGMPDEP